MTLTITRSGRAKYAEPGAGPRIQVLTSRHGALLFDLTGASLHKGDGHDASIMVMHPTGTDFEHSAAYLVILRLYGLVFEHLWGADEIEFSAYLTGARFYDDDVDPGVAGDDGEGVPAGATCDREGCDNHPIMAYQPPRQEIGHQPVWIQVYPNGITTEDG